MFRMELFLFLRSFFSQLNPDGSMGVEASMKGVAKDVKILAKVRQAYLPYGCEILSLY